MNNFNILIVAHNEKESVKLVIESIRMFADVDELSVILADNFSSDGLEEWAKTQTDFTYVFIDEGELALGRVINEVMEELQIKGDILIMGGHYLITPGCLSHMQDTLHLSQRTGAVGGLSNGFLGCQRTEKVMEISPKAGEGVKRVIGLCPGAILFRYEMLQKVGKFEERPLDAWYVMKDYCLRAQVNDWQLQVCDSACFGDIGSGDIGIEDSPEGERFLEEKWGMHYFNMVCNENLINLIKRDREEELWVLEIGCDCGANLVEIKNRYPNAHLYGLELNEKAVAIASHFATVTVGNVEAGSLEYENETFDYIIFGDVLEHLHDPLKTIEDCHQLLKEDGCIIASVPNIQHISVIEDLLRGNFTYTEIGLLDKTHIHFFTCYELLRMFQKGGYEVGEVGTTVMPLTDRQKELTDQLLLLQSGCERAMYEAFQYIVCARKGNPK